MLCLCYIPQLLILQPSLNISLGLDSVLSAEDIGEDQQIFSESSGSRLGAREQCLSVGGQTGGRGRTCAHLDTTSALSPGGP